MAAGGPAPSTFNERAISVLDAQELQPKSQVNPDVSTCPSLVWFLLLALIDGCLPGSVP